MKVSRISKELIESVTGITNTTVSTSFQRGIHVDCLSGSETGSYYKAWQALQIVIIVKKRNVT